MTRHTETCGSLGDDPIGLPQFAEVDLDRLTAKLAAGCSERDIREALSTGLGGNGFGALHLCHKVVGGHNDEEVDDESQQEEPDRSVEEVAILHDSAVDVQGQRGEVGLADYGSDERVDDVAHEGGHDRTEGCPDDDCDGEVEDIATKNKISESFNHGSISLK